MEHRKKRQGKIQRLVWVVGFPYFAILKKMKIKLFPHVFVLIAIAFLVVLILSIRFDAVRKSDSSTNTNIASNTNNSVPMSQVNATDSKYAFPGILPDEKIKNKKVRITTDKGDIVFELYPDDAPNTVSNFVYLTEAGFYDGLTFHRVEPGFVIQGGDPIGNGTGGPGYQFDDETVTRDYKKGIVAMANAGADTNGSQFFIVLEDTDLPKQYNIFGNVIEGMDVVESIVEDDVMKKVTIENL